MHPRHPGHPGHPRRRQDDARPCDILVLAAFPPELEPLRSHLGSDFRGRIGAAHVAAHAVGIGLSAASGGAALRIAEVQPRLVVLVGTCGAYPGAGLAVGRVAVARRVRLVDSAVVAGVAQFPDSMTTLVEADGAAADGLVLAGGCHADVATTLGVTVDDEAAERLSRATASQVEHMEAHGVAMACAAHGVGFAAALGVANIVGARAREEWRAHHRSASASALDVVRRWMETAPVSVGSNDASPLR